MSYRALIEKMVGPVAPETLRQFEKLITFLNPESEEDRVQVVKMLKGLFDIKDVSRETSWATVARQIDALPGEQKAKIQQLLAEVRRETVLKATGGKHPLAGMVGGPSPAEGGPQRPMVITKEKASEVKTRILGALTAGETSLQLTDAVRIVMSEDATQFAVSYKGFGTPRLFARYGDTARAEVMDLADRAGALDQACVLCLLAMEHETHQVVTKEKRHPLATWEFTGPRQNIPKVVV